MRVTPEELQNGASLNGNSEMCDSISQFGHDLGFMGLRENFTVTAPNCCCDDKHHKIRLKR